MGKGYLENKDVAGRPYRHPSPQAQSHRRAVCKGHYQNPDGGSRSPSTESVYSQDKSPDLHYICYAPCETYEDDSRTDFNVGRYPYLNIDDEKSVEVDRSRRLDLPKQESFESGSSYSPREAAQRRRRERRQAIVPEVGPELISSTIQYVTESSPSSPTETWSHRALSSGSGGLTESDSVLKENYQNWHLGSTITVDTDKASSICELGSAMDNALVLSPQAGYRHSRSESSELDSYLSSGRWGEPRQTVVAGMQASQTESWMKEQNQESHNNCRWKQHREIGKLGNINHRNNSERFQI